jgi:hypothetical protein
MLAPLWVERTLWFTPPLLQLTMSVLIVRRKLYREVPWFFAYILFSASQSIIVFFVRRKMPLYFYWYWIVELIALTMGFIIIYEVFRNIVNRYEGIQRVGFRLYRWCAVFLLFLATIMIASSPDLSSAVIIDAIITLQRGVRIMQVGLLVLLFSFTTYLGLSWRNCSFGVALGFGFLAAVELAIAALRLQFGADADQFYVLTKSIAYNCAALIWSAYIWQGQPATQTVTALPKAEVAVWNQTLGEFTRR